MLRRLLIVSLLAIACLGCKKKKQTGTTGAGTGTGTGSAPEGPALKLAAEYNITAAAGMCSANEHGSCPPDTECEPPPTRAIECPTGLADGNARVVMLDDKTCVVAPADCNQQGCLGAKTPCPLEPGQALPPLQWAVTALADGLCRASWTPPGSPSQSVTIKCPIPETSLVITRKSADGPCTAEHDAKSIEVPCPTEPTSFATVTMLRDALAKDAAALGKERVRVSGVFVKSLMFSKPQGKNTLFTIGASETKGDVKNAVKCTSILELTEIPDGDPIIVEGVPKKTGDEITLGECHASVP